MKTIPFDAAEYLDTEEAMSAYLADAREDGPEALSRAVEVVARARGLRQRGRIGVGSASVRTEAVMANKTTSSGAATAASKVLRDGRTGAASKTAAGSALSQVEKKSGPKKK